MAFWNTTAKADIDRSLLPPKSFFEKIRTERGMTERNFLQRAFMRGVEILYKELSEPEKREPAMDGRTAPPTHDPQGRLPYTGAGYYGGLQGAAPHAPVSSEREGYVFTPKTTPTLPSETPERGRRTKSKGGYSRRISRVIPKGHFRVRVAQYEGHNNARCISLGVSDAEPLVKAGFNYYKLEHEHIAGKTYIVFGKTLANGFAEMRVTLKPSLIFTIRSSETLERLSRLLGVRLQNAQLLRIVSIQMKNNDTEAWYEVQAGEIYY